MADKNAVILSRAQERFEACVSWEQSFRQRFKDDMKFLYADSDNADQWPTSVKAKRNTSGQVMVTINKTHTHWLHVVNHAKMNRPSIEVIATGGGATYESAQVFEQVIKRINYISDAESVYDKAFEPCVGGGVGYFRIITDYTDDDSFDQDIFLKAIPDPMSVYLDLYAKNPDGSDAQYAFVYTEMPRKDAEKKWPSIASVNSDILGSGASAWVKKDSVIVAEYYEKNTSKEWMYAMPSEDGEMQMIRESEVPKEGVELLRKAYEENSEIRRRKVEKNTIDHYLIVGDKIVEKRQWPGKYIPVVRVVGEEIVTDTGLDRKGLVRYMKDAQRTYNYNASAAIEFGALQSKTPYIAPIKAIEGVENYWATANIQNHAVLTYNHTDKQGDPIPAPSRQQPPSSAPVFSEGMQEAEHAMMMASGQYDATFSAQGNELSGVSIMQRIKQGERATFHYSDNLAKAIKFAGKQLIDLIPKIYDTRRVLKIMDESGKEHRIQIDPSAKKAMESKDSEAESKVDAIFNPSVGRYDVQSSVGPNYETRREAAFEAMTNMLAQNQALASVIGDLYMSNSDFPAADELQERMRNWIKTQNPAILGVGPSQAEVEMQQQLQMAQQTIAMMRQELSSKNFERNMEKQRLDLEALTHLSTRMEKERADMLNAFKAETERLKAFGDRLGEEALEPIARKLVSEIMRAPDPDMGSHANIDPAAIYAANMGAALSDAPLQQSEQPTVQQNTTGESNE